MAQSPYQITGLSSGGASVYLGGLYRKLQAGVTATAMSCSVEGSIHVSAGEIPAATGRDVFTIGNPQFSGDGTYAYSSAQDGFYQYVNVYAASMSSAYWDQFTIRLYFDGPQWASS